jgi:hypothetical protein
VQWLNNELSSVSLRYASWWEFEIKIEMEFDGKKQKIVTPDFDGLIDLLDF